MVRFKSVSLSEWGKIPTSPSDTFKRLASPLFDQFAYGLICALGLPHLLQPTQVTQGVP
jgi:hypothetical protein